jgi:hypothetical protein
MKKYASLGILGVFFVIGVTIALLRGASKPVQYTWKTVILDSSTNMYGGNGGKPYDDGTYKGWVYDDSDEFANVTVFVREYSSRAGSTYTPVFLFEVLSPAEIGLQGITFGSDDFGSDPNLNVCGFPDGGQFPSCWPLFLNGSHPRVGYQRVSFMHDGDRFMSRDEADFTKMIVGDSRVMNVHMVIQGQEVMAGCDQCNPTNYHQVDGDAHGYWKPETSSFDIRLTKIKDNAWLVVANTDFNNPSRQDQWPGAFSWGADKIWESYCECVPGTGKNGRLTKTIHYSSWVRTHLGYGMLFIRTPK